MTTIGITGATGALGTLVLDALLANGSKPANVVAFVRTPAKAADRAAAGIDVRTADYDDAAGWPAALKGVDTLLLISGSENGSRIPQHTAVIEGAKAAGVTRLVYTSILRADTTTNPLAPEHKATEELLAASGMAITVLRNGWYFENYTRSLGQYLATGEIVDATDGGAVSAASRADYAEAAARVLTTAGHEGRTYELGGTPAFTLAELAGTITEVTGTPVVERPVSIGELVKILETEAGLPSGVAHFVASLDQTTAEGTLVTESTDLQMLLGRPSTPLIDAVRAAANA